MTDNIDAFRQQPYDRALKSLMGDHAAEILPELLPNAQFIQEENSEITRLNIRADLVCRIVYNGTRCILNMELQTNADSNMSFRMLTYHIELYGKYNMPVISMVMYPFKDTISEPLFEEKVGDEVLLTFPHKVLKLWTLEADTYLHRHVVSMYTLLPAMKGITATKLLQAISEMAQEYSNSKEDLARHLRRFKTILYRSKTLSEQDKQIVEAKMESYDSLLESDPDIQKARAESEAKGQQRTLLVVVEARFPNLVELTRQQTSRLTKPDDVDKLTRLIATAPDENTARWLIETLAA